MWEEDKEREIVKTDGKAVPDIIKKNSENIFPRFETFRENIEGHYWFPTYTRSDDVLHFRSGPIHMRMTVRYANYKRFGVTIKLRTATEVKPDKPYRGAEKAVLIVIPNPCRAWLNSTRNRF